jgi:acetate kinase
MTEKQNVLVLNCGSSSVKFSIINPQTEETLLSGLVQNIGNKEANMVYKQQGDKQTKQLPHVHYQEALDIILNFVKADANLFNNIFAVGHRVVHGGEDFTDSTIIDEKVLEAIYACQDLAPLHNPANIMGIEEAKKIFPDLPQVAVFDTAFHQTMPNYAYLYAIPYELYTEHKVRRYGFHGTSHRFVAEKATTILNKPLEQCSLITAHLGNGCSITAIANGKSIDTSMGFTPLEGLVMGTRSGDVDPSLHSHLSSVLGLNLETITNLLNKKSGLFGISNISADMRTLESEIDNGNKQALLATEIFCYRLAKYIGAYAIPLGKIDALIFTGGIGENSPFIRAKTIQWLKILNFHLDEEKNNNNGKMSKGLITTKDSAIALVIPTNEELSIARDAYKLVISYKS